MTAVQASTSRAASPPRASRRVALGLHELLSRRIDRLGVFRPVIASEDDPLLGALRSVALEDAPVAVGVGYDDVRADERRALEEIVTRFHALAAQCDGVLVIGTDFAGVGTASELAFNGRVALNLGLPVLAVVSGHDRTAADVRSAMSVGADDAGRVGCSLAGGRRQPGRPRRAAGRCRPGGGRRPTAVRDPGGPTADGADRGRDRRRVPWRDGRRHGRGADARGERGARRGDDAAEPDRADHGERAADRPRRPRRRAPHGVLRAGVATRPRRTPASCSPAASSRRPRCWSRSTGCRRSCSPSTTRTRRRMPWPPASRARSARRRRARSPPPRERCSSSTSTAPRCSTGSTCPPSAVTPLMFQHDLLDRARAEPKRIVLPEGGRRADPARGRDPAAPPGRRADAARRRGRDPRQRHARLSTSAAPPCSTRPSRSCASASRRSTRSGARTRTGPQGIATTIVGEFITRTSAELPVDGAIPADWDGVGTFPGGKQMAVNEALIDNAPASATFGNLWQFVGAADAAGWIDVGQVVGPVGATGSAGVDRPDRPADRRNLHRPRHAAAAGHRVVVRHRRPATARPVLPPRRRRCLRRARQDDRPRRRLRLAQRLLGAVGQGDPVPQRRRGEAQPLRLDVRPRDHGEHAVDMFTGRQGRVPGQHLRHRPTGRTIDASGVHIYGNGHVETSRPTATACRFNGNGYVYKKVGSGMKLRKSLGQHDVGRSRTTTAAAARTSSSSAAGRRLGNHQNVTLTSHLRHDRVERHRTPPTSTSTATPTTTATTSTCWKPAS